MLGGGIKSRKRFQKTIHLLQAAGCPLEVADFRSGNHGPYSKSLARLIDEMTGSAMLVESEEDSDFGRQFHYSVSDDAAQSLESCERTTLGAQWREEIEAYFCLLDRLQGTRTRILELASSIVAFNQAGDDSDNVIGVVTEFNGGFEQSSDMDGAVALAENVRDWANANG